MKIVGVMGLVLGLMAGLLSQNNPSISLEEKPKNEIIFKDLTLTLDFILGTGKDKNNKFNDPSALAVDKQGDIYIADKRNNSIQVFSSSGEYLRTIGRKSGVKLSKICDLDMENEENLYVAEYYRTKMPKNMAIKMLSKNGEFIHSFNLPFIPDRITVNRNGIFVSERHILYEKHLVYKFSKNGEFIIGFGKRSYEGDIKNKVAQNSVNLASDSKGNIYLSHRFLPKVEKYSSEGELLMRFEYQPFIKKKQQPFEERFLMTEIVKTWNTDEGEKGAMRAIMEIKEYPICYDVAVDSSGIIHLLVAVDHTKDERVSIYRFDSSGNLLEKFDLSFPSCRMHIDASNNFYFSSTVKSLVYKYKLK